MTSRSLDLFAAAVLPIGFVAATQLPIKPAPVITVERARVIEPGMTRADVEAILGGPPGDYAGELSVTYVRGSVGCDETGYYDGTNWWGTKGMIQVQFSSEGLVEDVGFYPAHLSERIGFWDRLWGKPNVNGKPCRHNWVPGGW